MSCKWLFALLGRCRSVLLLVTSPQMELLPRALNTAPLAVTVEAPITNDSLAYIPYTASLNGTTQTTSHHLSSTASNARLCNHKISLLSYHSEVLRAYFVGGEVNQGVLHRGSRSGERNCRPSLVCAVRKF